MALVALVLLSAAHAQTLKECFFFNYQQVQPVPAAFHLQCTIKGTCYRWRNQRYNFDNLGQALMSLFVLASKDGWVDIMYNGKTMSP